MQKSIIRKGLVGLVIILFIGVGVFSNASSTSISSSDKEILEDEIEPADYYKEIYTVIDTYVVKGYVHGNPIWRFIPILYIGWLEVYNSRGFTIWGIRRPFSSFDTTRFSVDVTRVYTRFFIGEVFSGGPEETSVRGIAFGNIEYE